MPCACNSSGRPGGATVLACALAALVACTVSLLATAVPIARLRRLPTARLLAQERHAIPSEVTAIPHDRSDPSGVRMSLAEQAQPGAISDPTAFAEYLTFTLRDHDVTSDKVISALDMVANAT